VHTNGGHLEDVDADGWMDLVSHYRIEETGIALGDEQACVTGESIEGAPFRGCDSIVTPLQPHRRMGLRRSF